MSENLKMLWSFAMMLGLFAYFMQRGAKDLARLAGWLRSKAVAYAYELFNLHCEVCRLRRLQRWRRWFNRHPGIRSSRNITMLLLLMLAAAPAFASQTDWYFAQASAGANDGSSCANTHAVADFNDNTKWGSGSTQIGAGTTTHACGTLTTKVTFQAAGSAGLPIILKFETNAKWSAVNWPGTGTNGVIDMNAKSYVEVDGGTNGIIEDTDNGDPGVFGHSTDDTAISCFDCSHIRIHNLTIQNIFITAPATYVTNHTYGAGVVVQRGTSLQVDHNTVSNAYICINAGGGNGTGTFSAIELNNNTMSHCNWDIVVGLGAAPSTFDDIKIHDSDFSAWDNWDSTLNEAHHNGIFVFLENNCDQPGLCHLTNLQVYYNYFHGNVGEHMTALLFLDVGPVSGEITSPLFYNNLVNLDATNSPANGDFSIGNCCVTNLGIYNNTFSQASNVGGRVLAFNLSTATPIFKNNIVINAGLVFSVTNANMQASDYNDFFGYTDIDNVGADGSFAAWQAQGFDAHSITTNPSLDGSFVPDTGDPVYHTGISLSSLSITPLNTSKNAVARSGANWTMGANDAVGGGGGSPGTPLYIATMALLLLTILLPQFYKKPIIRISETEKVHVWQKYS